MIEGLFVLALYIIGIIAVFIVGDLVIAFYNAVVDKPSKETLSQSLTTLKGSFESASKACLLIKDDVRRVIVKNRPRDVIDDLVEGKLDPRPEGVQERKPIRKFVF